MTRQSLDRGELASAAKRAKRLGNTAMIAAALAIYAIDTAAMVAFRQEIADAGGFVRRHVENEALAGLICGLAVGPVVIAAVVIPFAVLRSVHRRIGVRCPSCDRSITLRCHARRVLRSGRCCLCGGRLF